MLQIAIHIKTNPPLTCSRISFLKIFLVYVSGALSASQIVDQMSLQKLFGRQWYVQAACATTGEGVYDAMSQLAPMVKKFKQGSR